MPPQVDDLRHLWDVDVETDGKGIAAARSALRRKPMTHPQEPA